TGALLAADRVGDGALTAGQGLAVILCALLVISPIDLVGQFFYIGIGGRAAQRAISAHLDRGRETEARPGGGAAGPGRARVILCALLVISPIDLVGQFFYIGIGGRAAQRAISAHLHRRREPDARPDEAAPGTGAPRIVLRDVTAGWTPDRPVLRDVSFTIEEGERVALTGPSGIGKSTVSALIQAHLKPASGSVVVAGRDTATTPPARVRRSLAVVEQRTHLFNGTIAD